MENKQQPGARSRTIAIVGGGVSGLSTAYYLMKDARRQGARLDIHVFERKHMWGGNADTVVVDLGRLVRDGAPPTNYFRWADLGVNDANLAAYARMKAVMKDIGYLDHMKKLENTASYFSADGSRALTDDGDMTFGVSDPRFCLQDADAGRLWPLIRVVHQTAINLLKTIGVDYTCQDYFNACVDDPEAMLSDAARQLDIEIQWDDPQLPARIGTLRDDYYYPRISAMYFTDDRGPQGMPLQAPFEYYQVQEGGGTPDRRYFSNGAQKWLEALETHLKDKLANDQVRITLHLGTPVQVRVHGEQVWIDDGKTAPKRFDLGVIATHADDARDLLRFEGTATAAGEKLNAILESVRYTFSYAVCHTAALQLPENKNVWRTYNIPIRSREDSIFPYRISYVCNMHQNDSMDPRYNAAGLPQFFVSLVDSLNSVPLSDMLDRVLDEKRLPPELRAELPKATLKQFREGLLNSGYRDRMPQIPEALFGKAWTTFKHNILNAECIRAQQAMQTFNEGVAHAWLQARAPVVPLLFGGGWTNGAGLHEQCLAQAQQISRWLLPQ